MKTLVIVLLFFLSACGSIGVDAEVEAGGEIIHVFVHCPDPDNTPAIDKFCEEIISQAKF